MRQGHDFLLSPQKPLKFRTQLRFAHTCRRSLARKRFVSPQPEQLQFSEGFFEQGGDMGKGNGIWQRMP
jgi:hypothetical protein